MKVLFLTNIPSPYRVEFFKELGKYVDLTVCYELPKATDRADEFKAKDCGDTYRSIIMPAVVKQASSAFCPSVKRHIKDFKLDIIVVGAYSTPTGMYAIEYMRRHHIPYILNCDGGMVRGEQGFQFWVKKHFISGAKCYLSTGKVCDEYLEYYGAEKSRINRYPFSSVKATEILKDPICYSEKKTLQKGLGLLDSAGKTYDEVFITVGSNIHRKGNDLLLKSMEKLDTAGKKIGLYMIGGDPTDEYLELSRNVKKSNDKIDICFVPFKRSEELRSYYMAGDLFILPTREDIWGLVINEAAAAGLPIIATDKCVAAVELLRHSQGGGDNGFDQVVELELGKEEPFIETLRERISDFLNLNAYARKGIGEKNLEVAAQYSIEEMAHKNYEILSKSKNRVLFVGSMVPEEIEERNKDISAAGNRFQNNMIKNMRLASYDVRTLSYIGCMIDSESHAELIKNTEYVLKQGRILKAIRCFKEKLYKEIMWADIVVSYNPVYAWFYLPGLAKKKVKKSILILADYSGPECFDGPRRIKSRLNAYLQLVTIRKYDVVIGLSANTKRYLRRSQKFVLVEGGIDRELRDSLSVPPSEKHEGVRFLYSGLLSEVTGVDILIEAINELPAGNWELYISGKGPLEETVRKASENNSHIKYLGHVTYDDYIEQLRRADILLNPRNMNLMENQNNFPSKIMDYLAAGKTIISTKFVGWEKFDKDIIFCNNSAEDMRENIIKCIETNNLIRPRRELAEGFMWDKLITMLL